MERSAVVPGSQIPVRVARLTPRLVRQHQDERVQRVSRSRLNPLETLVGERFRRTSVAPARRRPMSAIESPGPITAS